MVPARTLVLATLCAVMLIAHHRRLRRETGAHSDAAASGQSHLAGRPSARLLRCPSGSYQSEDAHRRASRALAAHWDSLLRAGYQSRAPPLSEPSGRAQARGFVVFEDPEWPRRRECAAMWGRNQPRRRARPRVRLVVAEPPGTCEPNGTQCDKWRISQRHQFVWHHVWKAGTTSLSPYLSCNLEALPVPRLLHRLPGRPPGYLHVGSAREPLSRFLSGFQEVYARALASEHSRCRAFGVPWLRLALRAGGADGAGGGCPIDRLSPADVARVLRQFVADVGCGVRFANGEHLLSQSLFLGGNASAPSPVDMLLRLESLPRDIAALRRRVGHAAPELCPLGRERAQAAKPPQVPSQRELRAVLTADGALMQAVCDLLMTDFLCLGYPLPQGCAVGGTRRGRQGRAAENG